MLWVSLMSVTMSINLIFSECVILSFLSWINWEVTQVFIGACKSPKSAFSRWKMALLWFTYNGTKSQKRWIALECFAQGDHYHTTEGNSLKDSFIQNEVQHQKLLGNILAINSTVASSPRLSQIPKVIDVLRVLETHGEYCVYLGLPRLHWQ